MSNQGPIPEIEVDDLARLVEAGTVVLDVRMADEYEEGHVPGAVLIPLPELAGRIDEVPAATPLHVICRSGARSMKACELLAGSGRDVVNVAGGTLAWVESGRDVATGSERG